MTRQEFISQYTLYPSMLTSRMMGAMCGLSQSRASRIIVTTPLRHIRVLHPERGNGRPILLVYKEEVLDFLYNRLCICDTNEPYITEGKVLYESEFADYPDIVNLKQASEMLGYGKNSVLRWIHNNELPYFCQFARGYKMSKSEIIEFVLAKRYRSIVRKSKIHIEREAKIQSIIERNEI